MASPRAVNHNYQERVVVPYDHASLTADTTVKLFNMPREGYIEKVEYVNPTGLATDATNYFNIKVLNEALVAANWSTETGQEGTITADTFVSLVIADANKHLVAGEELSVFFDETGTATLPAGRLLIHLVYL